MALILIAEDDPHMLRILSIWLQRNGHEVCEARNGLEARERFSERSFDFVVSDVNMPEMSGIELVEWLRTERQSEVPVILLSSRCDQTVISKKLNSFDVQVYPKPFSPSKLVDHIERRLAEVAKSPGPAAQDAPDSKLVR